jgi:hypothetical protein
MTESTNCSSSGDSGTRSARSSTSTASPKNGSGFHLEIVAPESGVETPREAEAHYASSPQHKTFSDFFERIFPELGSIGPSDELVSEIVDEILEDEDGEEVPA